MKKTKIFLAEPDLTRLEKKYLTEAFDSTFISSAGAFVEKFEKKFANYIGTRFATTTSNGTAALHLILEALGVEGKEVIVPNLTFAATASVVIHARGIPKLVDCGEDWNLDPKKVAKAINKKTKAIIAVHLYGQPSNMGELKKVAEKKGIAIIEDCAEAFGAKYGNKKVGSLCLAGAFSFYGNKIISTGEGGMITTNNKKLFETMILLKNHGMSKKKRYWHDLVGYNCRLTNLQAAIGLGQLERIGSILKKRETVIKQYDKLLDKKKFELQKDFAGRKRVCWLYPVLAKNKSKRNLLMKGLKEKGIDSRKFFYPLSQMKPYKSRKKFPVSSNLSERGLVLPCHTSLTKKEITIICKTANLIK